MLLCAYLGVTRDSKPVRPPYLRILAFNDTGRALLREMASCAAVPILTKPAAVKRMPEEAQRLFALEAGATDLYVLAYPDLQNSRGGTEWRNGAARVRNDEREEQFHASSKA